MNATDYQVRRQSAGGPSEAEIGPTLTVIIPALNEAANIGRAVKTTHARLPGAHVIVVDGGSSDPTAMLASQAGAEVVSSPCGRGMQLAAGAERATTEWLLFLHADTVLPEDAARVVENFRNRPDACIATFRLSFDQAGWFLRACCWFTRFDTVFTRFGDQGILIRRDFYGSLGGFKAWPLFEDVELLQRARRVTRVWSLPAAVTTSARRFDSRGHLSQQSLNAWLIFRYIVGTSPERLAEIYRASGQRARRRPPAIVPPLYEAERSTGRTKRQV